MTAKQKHRFILFAVITILVAYVSMVALCVVYVRQTDSVLSDRFDDVVSDALTTTSRALEEQEMITLLTEIASDTAPVSTYARTLLINIDNHRPDPSFHPRSYCLPSDAYAPSARQLHDVQHHLQLSRELMLEVIARKYTSRPDSIADRIDTAFLHSTLTSELTSVGVNGYCDIAVTRVGPHHETLFITHSPFNLRGSDTYHQMVFHRDVSSDPLFLVVRFPSKSRYLHRYMRLVLPIVISMSILAILVFITILYLFRSQRLSEIQNAFIKNMTHELKTPVASISLASEMLADPSIHLTPESFAAKARTINHEAKRLTGIIERVLQTSILERDSTTFNIEAIDIHSLILDSREAFALKVENNSGAIHLNLDAQHHIVYADRMHLTNVIFNLMENAVKYSEPSRPLVLRISTRNRKNRILIDIADNGIGIESKYLKNLFDRFFRVPQVSEHHDVKGFGLGLAYVKDVIRRNGGSIAVRSQIGVGTTFTITFPSYDS